MFYLYYFRGSYRIDRSYISLSIGLKNIVLVILDFCILLATHNTFFFCCSCFIILILVTDVERDNYIINGIDIPGGDGIKVVSNHIRRGLTKFYNNGKRQLQNKKMYF